MSVTAAVQHRVPRPRLAGIPDRLCISCSRYIDGRKCAVAQQKTMKVATCVTVDPDDVASRVDSGRDGESSSRYIDGRKCAVAQQKTMKVATCVAVDPDDVASRIDRFRSGKRGSRYINGGKLLLRGQPNRDW